MDTGGLSDPAAGDASFESAFESLRYKPCKVAKLVVRGLQRTRIGVVHQELERVRQAGSLEEIKDTLLDVHADLMGLGIFKAVDIVVEETGEGDRCAVVASFKEKELLSFHSGTYVQGTEGSVEVELQVKNAAGYAEQLALSIEHGLQRASVCSVSLAKPRPWGKGMVAEARLHQLHSSQEQWSSFVDLFRGGMATLSSEDGRHLVSYEVGWRRLTDPSRTASREVVAQLGDQLKSAAAYVYKAHAFDKSSFPLHGWGLRSMTEVAGLGHDANLLRFVKQHVSGQVVLPVWSGQAALHLSGEVGLLLPWLWGARAQSSISDRFFLGGMGAGSLRGFAHKGVGPSAARRPPREVEREGGEQESPEPSPRRPVGRDALGGDLLCTLMASLRFRLPHEGLDKAGVHGHVFVNGGNLMSLSGVAPRPASAAWREAASTFRWSAGVGIEWVTSVGRLDISLARVLKRSQHDRVHCEAFGLQFGFGPPQW